MCVEGKLITRENSFRKENTQICWCLENSRKRKPTRRGNVFEVCNYNIYNNDNNTKAFKVTELKHESAREGRRVKELQQEAVRKLDSVGEKVLEKKREREGRERERE